MDDGRDSPVPDAAASRWGDVPPGADAPSPSSRQTDGDPSDAGQEVRPVGRLGIGRVVVSTFSTLFKNPALYFGLALCASFPRALSDEMRAGSPLWALFLIFLGGFCSTFIQGSIAYGVYRTLRGGKAPVAEALTKGMARLLSLIGVSLISSIVIGLGLLLLVVPGLALSCMFAVAVPACVVEGLGAVDSLSRSSKLTEGNRWSIFGIMALEWLVVLGITTLLAVVYIGLFGREIPAVVSLAINTLFTAFSSVLAAALYYELRLVREGVSVDKLASVFD